MKHRARARKLGRTTSHRLAMLRNMVTSLLDHERIRTTDAKAKEVRRVADRMITLGKRGDLHARRRALRVIRSRDVTAKVFDELADRYRDRPGGYTRVLKLGRRPGDAAPVSIVELVQEEAAGGAKSRATKKATPKKKAAAREKAPRETKKAASKKSSDEKKAGKKTGKKTAKKAPAAGSRKKTATKKTTKKKSSRKSD